MDRLNIAATIQVAKPAAEVFEAIADPEKMKNYFIAASSGRMEEGKQLTWKFPEFDMEVPVEVGKMIPGQYISYYWAEGELKLLVEMELQETANGQTVVRVREGERANDEAGIKWLKQNTEGWANFLACLKAFLEYGINLRKGAFDFMRQ